MKKKIFIDFDGVINDYHGWQNGTMPAPKEGALEFVKELSANYELCIFTSRNCEEVLKWLENHHFKKYIKTVTNQKEPAHIYIDDRGIRFDGDYQKLSSEINEFSPYWKN